jgi:acyl-CoA thioesterase
VSAPFARAMSVKPLGDGAYGADVADDWTIGPKVHGGTLLSLCAAAAEAELAADGFVPLAVSADYLGAPDPGEMTLTVRTRKRGRRIGLLDVELGQGERMFVRAAVTLGQLDAGEPVATVPTPAHDMPPEPPEEAIAVADNPMAQIVHLSRVCDMRFDPKPAAFLRGKAGEPVHRMWIRPKDEEPSTLFALMCGDVTPPVTINLGRFGWAPTIQLTTYLRAVPSPGWLRVVATSSSVGDGWFDQDEVVVDQSGAVVAQGRQLAMVPAPGGGF